MTNKDDQDLKNESINKNSLNEEASSISKESGAKDYVNVSDMHELLLVLREGLASRDKAVDYLQKQIELNQRQIEQNKKILAKRGLIYKLAFILLAIGVLMVGFDQHTIVRSFDKDMTNVSKDMDLMLVEMQEMRKAMAAMSKDINSMSYSFTQVARDVNSISHGVYGMSYDTRQMNRQMDTMTPPWTPFK